MQRFSYFTLWAQSGDPKGAARAFLSEADEPATAKLLDAALWRDEDVASFEAEQRSYLIDSPAGRFWLAPRDTRKVLLPPAPKVSPAGVVALARAIVEALVCETSPGD